MLVIGTPEWFLRPPTLQGALNHPFEDQREWIIQPDQNFSARPDQVACVVVVSGLCPGGGMHVRFDFLAEFFQVGIDPTRFPIQGIQFDEIKIKFLSQLFCKHRFTKASHADHDDAFIYEERDMVGFHRKHPIPRLGM